MHNFKKALLATLGFLACVLLAAAVIVWPYFTGEYYYYEDAQVREELAGSLNVIVSGASHGYCAFDPSVLDEELGVNSYNLSGSLMTMCSRAALLRKELARNPVDTVLIELSLNTLTRDRVDEGPEGDIYALPRMGSLANGIGFFFEAFAPEEYLSVCADTLDRGLDSWSDLLHNEPSKVPSEDKGFLRRDAQDLSMTPEEFDQFHHMYALPEDALWENKEYLLEMVELCQTQGVEVIFITTPISDQMLAQYSNLELPYQWYQFYAQQYGCQFLDFNLYRQRDALFPDETAFYDKAHLSASGAEIFSRELADLYLRIQNGEDISSLFYESYEEVDAALCEAYRAS